MRPIAWIAVLGTFAALGASACGASQEPSEGASMQANFESLTTVAYPSGGGGSGPTAPESNCDPQSPGLLTVATSSRSLSWQVCNTESTLAVLREGERALTEPEFDSVVETLDRVSVGNTDSSCGADAGFTTLDVQKKSGTELYISSSNCGDAGAGRQVATGVGDVWSTLMQLSTE